jgi:hypothetical protein
LPGSIGNIALVARKTSGGSARVSRTRAVARKTSGGSARVSRTRAVARKTLGRLGA